MSINVCLVDDHKMLREGIKQLLEFDSDIKVVYQASNADELFKDFLKLNVDVFLLDINLPGKNGIEVLKMIKHMNKEVRVIMLTVHNEIEYLISALDNKADGYVLKESGSSELIRAIKTVNKGNQYIQPDLIPMLNSRLVKRNNETDLLNALTKREKQILICIAEGKNNLDISKEFDISEQTVKNHITSMFKKIEVKDRTQAAVFAIRNNLVNV